MVLMMCAGGNGLIDAERPAQCVPDRVLEASSCSICFRQLYQLSHSRFRLTKPVICHFVSRTDRALVGFSDAAVSYSHIPSACGCGSVCLSVCLSLCMCVWQPCFQGSSVRALHLMITLATTAGGESMDRWTPANKDASVPW